MRFIAILPLLFFSTLAFSYSPIKVVEYAERANFFDPILLVALADVESSFNPKAVGPHGSLGIMQLQYATAQLMGFTGQPSQLYNWAVNVKYSIKYLNHLNERYKGHVPSIVSAYNAGTAYKKKNGKFVNQAYVDKVLNTYSDWDNIKVDKIRSENKTSS